MATTKVSGPQEKKKYFDPSKQEAGAAEPKRRLFQRGVSSRGLTQFTTQLATLQDAGLPIVKSLKILAGQMRPGLLKTTVAAVAEDVEGGNSFSEALGKHPHIFDKLYVSMVKAGEAGGVLDTILKRLADLKEKQEKLRTQIKGATMYPAFVMVFALGIIFFITAVVVPKFKEIFKDLGESDLPKITQALLGLSAFLRSYWYVIFLIPVFLWLVMRLVTRAQRGRRTIDRAKLHLPKVGGLVRRTKVARICRTLGTLLGSGVPLLEAFDIVKRSIGNAVLEDAMDQIRASVTEGEGIAEPMGETRVFDDMVVNMVDVGEETGALDKMLLKIADTYDYEVDIEVAGLVRLLEPLLIIFVGGVAGFVIFAVFLPLLKIVEKLSA